MNIFQLIIRLFEIYSLYIYYNRDKNEFSKKIQTIV